MILKRLLPNLQWPWGYHEPYTMMSVTIRITKRKLHAITNFARTMEPLKKYFHTRDKKDVLVGITIFFYKVIAALMM